MCVIYNESYYGQCVWHLKLRTGEHISISPLTKKLKLRTSPNTFTCYFGKIQHPLMILLLWLMSPKKKFLKESYLLQKFLLCREKHSAEKSWKNLKVLLFIMQFSCFLWSFTRSSLWNKSTTSGKPTLYHFKPFEY